MEVVLLKAVPPLGKRGDKVRVKRGYARNFLFPRKLAVAAIDSNLRAFKEEEKLINRRSQQELEAVKELAINMEGVSCTILVQAGEDDKLYGSVTSSDIAGELKKQGYDIEKKRVLLEEPIKKLGVYTVDVRLHEQVNVAIKVWVVKE